MLEREDQPSAPTQRPGSGRDHRRQIAEVHQRVGRHDHVELVVPLPKELRQLGLDQHVVDLLSRARASIPADKSTPVNRRANGARNGAQSPVPQPASLVLPRWFERRLLQHGRHERGRAVGQTLEPRLERRGEPVERLLDELVRRAGRRVTAAAGGEHVPGDRIARILGEPRLEDLSRPVELAQRAMRQRQQPRRVVMRGTECDRLAEAHRGFFRTIQAVAQDPEVRVRIDVMAMAARYSASASPECPVARSSTPRLLWVLACRGATTIARRYASTAPSSPPAD